MVCRCTLNRANNHICSSSLHSKQCKHHTCCSLLCLCDYQEYCFYQVVSSLNMPSLQGCHCCGTIAINSYTIAQICIVDTLARCKIGVLHQPKAVTFIENKGLNNLIILLYPKIAFSHIYTHFCESRIVVKVLKEYFRVVDLCDVSYCPLVPFSLFWIPFQVWQLFHSCPSISSLSS